MEYGQVDGRGRTTEKKTAHKAAIITKGGSVLVGTLPSTIPWSLYSSRVYQDLTRFITPTVSTLP